MRLVAQGCGADQAPAGRDVVVHAGFAGRPGVGASFRAWDIVSQGWFSCWTGEKGGLGEET